MAVLLLALLLGACGSREGGGDPLPVSPRRVICGTPAVAEIVFALGAGDRVVGVSDFTDYPPEAANRPSIGGALAPSRERILALQPDLILSQGRAEGLAELARDFGIPFYSLPLDTLDDVRAAIVGYAAALGEEQRGLELRSEMEAALAAVPGRDPVALFIALGHAPGDLSGLMTAGKKTYLNELVEIAGGRNIFADVHPLWPKISPEALIRRAPELILDIQPGAPDAARRAALVADWERLGFRADQVRILEADLLLRPGPRAPQAAARLAAALSQ